MQQNANKIQENCSNWLKLCKIAEMRGDPIAGVISRGKKTKANETIKLTRHFPLMALQN